MRKLINFLRRLVGIRRVTPSRVQIPIPYVPTPPDQQDPDVPGKPPLVDPADCQLQVDVEPRKD
jgi:hypothetical protein